MKTAYSLLFAAAMAVSFNANADEIGNDTIPQPQPVDSVKVTGISISPKSIELYTDETASFTATIIPDSATVKDVTWSIAESADSELLTLTPDGDKAVLSFDKNSKGGNFKVIATSVEGDFADTCNVVAIEKAKSISLNKRDITLYPGETVTNLQAYLKYNDGTMTAEGITWVIEREDIAYISAPGEITGVSQGWTKLIVSGGGLSLEATVHVLPPMDTIFVTPSEMIMTYGETRRVTATILPESAASAVTWSLEPTKPKPVNVTINAKGDVTTVHDKSGIDKPQTVYAVATAGSHSARCKIDIIIPATAITLSPTTLTLENGTEGEVIATVTPEGTSDVPEWESSDATVASVGETTTEADEPTKVHATVVPHRDGTAVITAKIRDISAICLVTVKSTSGVTDIETIDDAPCEVFDLSGKCITNGLMVSELQSKLDNGLYIVRINGNSYKISIRK